MLWTILSLANGIAQTLANAYTKKAAKEESRAGIIFSRYAIGAAIFLLLWIFQGASVGIVNARQFILVITTLVSAEILSQVFFLQALKRSALSILMPFESFTPLFMLPLAYLFLNELPRPLGALGVIMIVAGLAILSVENSGKRVKFSANLLKDKGVRFMILTVILWAITSTLQKNGVKLAGVSFFGLCYIGGTALVLFLYHWISGDSVKHVFGLKGLNNLTAIGFWSGVVYITQFVAMGLVHPAYIIALKRVAGPLYLIWDKKFFGEKMNGWIISGNILSFAGAVVLVLASVL